MEIRRKFSLANSSRLEATSFPRNPYIALCAAEIFLCTNFHAGLLSSLILAIVRARWRLDEDQGDGSGQTSMMPCYVCNVSRKVSVSLFVVLLSQELSVMRVELASCETWRAVQLRRHYMIAVGAA